MFDIGYMDYYGRTTAKKGEPKIVSEITLSFTCEFEYGDVLGTVFTQEKTFNNFLETENVCSYGKVIRNKELPDGRRMSEDYDSLTGEYICKVFDNKGTLLTVDRANRSGAYYTSERNSDGTYDTQEGVSPFIRCFDGKMI